MEGSVTNRRRAGPLQPSSGPGQMPPEYARTFPGSDAEAAASGREITITLWRSKWSLLAFAVIGAILTGVIGLMRPVLYEAKAQLIIAAPPNTGVAVTQDVLNASIDDHLTIMMSQSQLLEVIAALKADEDKSLIAGLRARGAQAGTLSSAAGRIDLWTDRLREFIGRPAASTSRVPRQSETYALAGLQNNLRVGQELRSRVISAGFLDRDPATAARIVNTVAQVYVDRLKQQALNQHKRELASVNERIPRLQNELAQATRNVENYRLSQGLGNQATADATASEISQLRQLVSAAKANLAAAQEKRNSVPDEQGADAMRLDNAVQVFAAQLASLEERAGTLKADAVEMSDRLSGLRAFELERDAAVGRYNDLLAKRETLEARIAAPAPGIAILSAATAPAYPKTMSPLFLIPPGAIMFALLGAVIAVLRRNSDNTLRGEAEAEMALGIPVAGLLPAIGRPTSSRLQRVLSGQPGAAYSRATASVLFSLASFGGASRLPRVVLVTSATRHDEKTELAWSMAATAARIGTRVLFLDLDTQPASLTTSFRKSFGDDRVEMTFTDVARGNCAIEEAVETMPQTGVDFIAAPRANEDLLALLTTSDIDGVIGRLREAYGMIIVNGPAGVEGPEAALLTNWADAVLFAVHWGKTARNVARTAVDRIARDSAGPVPITSVLTGMNLKKHASYRFGDAGDLMRLKV